MHAKYALVDEAWCSIGTFNATAASVGLANEVNVFLCDPSFVARLAGQFEADLGRARRVTHAAAHARPTGQRSVDALAWNALSLVDALWGRR